MELGGIPDEKQLPIAKLQWAVIEWVSACGVLYAGKAPLPLRTAAHLGPLTLLQVLPVVAMQVAAVVT